MKKLQAGLLAQRKKLEADFSAQKKELETEYQRQRKECYPWVARVWSKISEGDAIKLRTVVGYDCLRDSKPTNDVLQNEFRDIFVLDASIRLCFYPFTEVISGNEQEFLLGSCNGQGSHYVQCFKWHMRDGCMPLAFVTFLDISHRILFHRQNGQPALGSYAPAWILQVLGHALVPGFVFLLYGIDRMACSNCSLVEDCSSSPTPDPDDREAPSTCKVHHSVLSNSPPRAGCWGDSTTKSAITCPFMDNLGRYSIPYSLNSMSVSTLTVIRPPSRRWKTFAVVCIIFSSFAFDHYVINLYFYYATNQGSKIFVIALIEATDGWILIISECAHAKTSPSDGMWKGWLSCNATSPIYLITDACKRSTELPGSTKIRLMLKSPIPRDRIRALRYGCNIRVGSTRGKMIVPSIRWALPPVNPGRMELIRSHTDAAHSSLCLFRLESDSSSRGPPWM
ncbi:hypothetical protein AAG906_036823 [Vitis piasezkii]